MGTGPYTLTDFAVGERAVLELGIDGQGIAAENHHVSTVHPEYAQLPKQKTDPERARELLAEAGMADFEHELSSLEDGWRKDSTDAVAAQLRDAGLNVTRKLYPGSTYWNGWKTYPFSSTNWYHRALGVQIYAIVYRSGVPWNETGFSDAEFDNLLDQALATVNVDKRRELMAQMQAILQDDGAIIQPYWRELYHHAKADVQGMPMHQSYEIHLDKIWRDA